MYYLGGMTIQYAGWINPTTVYIDFVSQYTTDWLWQLYCNRSLVGCTRSPSERRMVGQLVASVLPAPLTLVRVDAANILTDYSAFLPVEAWNRFKVDWVTAGMSADTDHFDIVESDAPGGSIDLTNVIAKVPFGVDGAYSFELPPFEANGAWAVGIVPRDNALPLGNAGTPATLTANVLTPPPDVAFNADGSRFVAAIAAGVLTVSFVY